MLNSSWNFVEYKKLLYLIQNGYNGRRSFIKIGYNPKYLKLLNVFVRVRYVGYYKLLPSGFLRIGLVYDVANKPKFLYNWLLFTYFMHSNVSYEQMALVEKDNKFNAIYILKTDVGLLSHIEAINLRKNGIAICVLYTPYRRQIENLLYYHNWENIFY